jgi:hypothetical protein
MIRLHRVMTLLITTCVMTVAESATILTLPEIARLRAPGPVFSERINESVPSRFEPLVADADLIVHGTVKPIRTVLSKDQQSLFTEYLVSPIRVIFQKTPQSGRVPGLPAPIIVTRWGGSTVIEGVHVTVRDREAPSLDETPEFVLYLAADDATKGMYHFVNQLIGAMGVLNGRVQLVAKDDLHANDDGFKQIRAGVTVDELESMVRDIKSQ